MTGTAECTQSSWPGVICVAAGAFVMVTSEFIPIGLLSNMAGGFSVPAGRAGTLVTMPGLVAAFAAPACIIVAGQADRRHLLIGFTFVVLVSNLVVASATTLEAALMGRALLGVSVGGFWTFAAAVGRKLVAEQSGNRATSIIIAGISFGTVVGVPFGSALGSLAGWRFAFGAVAMLCLLVILAQFFLLPRITATTAQTLRSMLSIGRNRELTVIFAAAAMASAGHFAAYTYFEPHLVENAGASSGALAWLLAIYGAMGGFGAFLGERLARGNPAAGFMIVTGGMTLSIFMTAELSVSQFEEALSVALWGLSFGAVPVCVQIWIYAVDPWRFETNSALMVSVFQIALAAGSFSGGLLADQFGLSVAFSAGSLLNLVCTLLIGATLLRSSRDQIKET